MKLTVNIEGETREDILGALNDMYGRITDGHIEGKGDNDTCVYDFKIEGLGEPAEEVKEP